MKGAAEHEEKRSHKLRHSTGYTPAYKAFHEVSITRELRPGESEDVIAFIQKHIAEFKGQTEPKHGIPIMLFERKQDASKFANKLIEKLNIHKEHVAVKARKFTR